MQRESLPRPVGLLDKYSFRSFAPIALSVLFVALYYQSCGTVKTLDGTLKSESGSSLDADTQCLKAFSIAQYLEPKESCYQVQANEFDTVFSLDQKRMLTPWIPCNEVQLVSMASNDQFQFDKAIAWVAKENRFSIEQIQTALQQPEKPLASVSDHPAFDSPNHKALVSLIRNAKHTLFFNAIIFGGAWGSELIREMMLRKAQAGIEILILRDTENVFAFASELVPVWKSLVDQGVKTDGLTVIRSDITARNNSAIPFGLERLTKLAAPFTKEGVSLSGKSDHTKILIADGFTDEATMFVTSKNPSDYNLLNYDESAIVTGPAAAAAQASFTGDIKLGEALAVRESKQQQTTLISEEDREMLKRWYAQDERLRDPSPTGLKFAPRGKSAVRLSENNADDSIRNTEMGVLQLVAGAKKNLRIYNFLSYNPMLARAIADATLRLGPENVKIISDATLTFAANMTFDPMVRNELKKAGQDKEAYADQILKWRITAPPVSFAKNSGRIGITQQQHTKTIIVDDEVTYLGSTNFDFATLAGSFREFSVSIRDSKTALESAATFDKLWTNNKETTSTQEMLRTGGPTKAKVPAAAAQTSLINLLKTEQDRIGALNPRNFVRPEKCN